MGASEFALIGSVIVSGLGALFGLYQARKADRSATTTKTIELGVTNLIDQYQEANEQLRDETHECKERCKVLESEVRELRRQVYELKMVNDHLITELDNNHATIIRLKNLVGESIDE